MNCKDCKYFKRTHIETGICKLWDESVRGNDNCEEFEE